MSNRRPYFNLKQSILELFKTRAYYLKELTGKFSEFEKPYLEGEYQPMHLQLPRPTWGGSGGAGGDERGRKVRFVFREGECSLWGFQGECGETIELSGWIGLPPIGSEGAKISWTVTSSDKDLGDILSVTPSLYGMAVDILVQLSDDGSGTVSICAKAALTSGYYLKELEYTIPPWMGGPHWTPRLEWAMNNLLPNWETHQTPGWDCGCVEVEVSCCDDSGIAWSNASDDAIVPNDFADIAITDSLGIGGPYSWSVSGTGFSLLWSSTNGLVNVLETDGTACGTAVITVTGCNGAEVTGYVTCSIGNWHFDQTYPAVCDPYPSDCWCAVGAGGRTAYFSGVGHRAVTNKLTGGKADPGSGYCADGLSLAVEYTYNFDGYACSQYDIFDYIFGGNANCLEVGCWETGDLQYWGC